MATQVYSAESRVKNFRQVLREMLRGVRGCRYVGYRLARNNIVGQYAQSVLGFLWDFADPLVLGTIFFFLYRHKIFETGDLPIPYFVFVTFGLLLFQTFASAVLDTLNVLRSSRGLITQQKLPPEALLASIFFQVGFFSLIRMAVMIFLAGIAGALSPLGLIPFILGFPVLILCGMSIGVFLAPFNAIYRDVGRFVSMVLVPLRFISPVLFPLEGTVFESTKYINPFWTVMDNLRLLATENTTSDLPVLGMHLAVLLVVGLVGWFIFHISVPILAERV